MPGNYGTKDSEVESDSVKIAGLICKNFSFEYSRPGADRSLEDFFEKNNTLAISDVDTRALVSYIRDNGAMNAVISTDVNNIEGLKKPPFAGRSVHPSRGRRAASRDRLSSGRGRWAWPPS